MHSGFDTAASQRNKKARPPFFLWNGWRGVEEFVSAVCKSAGPECWVLFVGAALGLHNVRTAGFCAREHLALVQDCKIVSL